MRAIHRWNTSASNVHRRVRCPGSASAEEGLPEQESEWSEEGTLLHLGFASAPLGVELPDTVTVTTEAGDLVVLSEEQRDLVLHARALASRALEKTLAEFKVSTEEPFEEGFERELWLRQGIKPIMPGHCDYWRYYVNRALLLIIDAKFGFLVVDAAPLNWQLRTYALMGAAEWTVENCVVAIVQPRAAMLGAGETLSIAVYEAESLPLAKAQLLEYREAWLKPNAPRIASDEACLYCKAKLTCDAYRLRLSPTANLSPGVLPAVSALSDEQFLALYEGWKLAQSEPVAKLMKAEARLRISEGRMPGYAMKENAPRRGITSARGAFFALSDYGIPDGDILDCMSLPLAPVEKRLRQFASVTAAGAKDIANEILADVIELTTPEPSIVKADPTNPNPRLLTE